MASEIIKIEIDDSELDMAIAKADASLGKIGKSTSKLDRWEADRADMYRRSLEGIESKLPTPYDTRRFYAYLGMMERLPKGEISTYDIMRIDWLMEFLKVPLPAAISALFPPAMIAAVFLPEIIRLVKGYLDEVNRAEITATAYRQRENERERFRTWNP